MSQQSIGTLNFSDIWCREHLGPFGRDHQKEAPYDFYIFPNLLDDFESVEQIRKDVNSNIKLKLKDNDLYKFKQSKDLRTEIPAKKLTPLLHKFIDVMLGPIRGELEKLAGLELSTKNFDITASRYDPGNYLLCHNDDIKDDLKQHSRSLAFIYYLNNRIWTPEDGGALVIYDSDADGEPVSINNYIMPLPNTLVVFRTSPISWHSVQEVYCRNDTRLSINGWFHVDGPRMMYEDEKTIEPCPYKFYKPVTLDDRLESIFKDYFNPEYLMEKTCLVIRRRFKKQSEINLTNFLTKDKFQEISRALKFACENDDNLVHVGPYNKRNYRIIKYECLPEVCKNLYDAFRSELFFLLLARLTGLDLQPPTMKCANPTIDEDQSSGSDLLDEEDDDDDREELDSDKATDDEEEELQELLRQFEEEDARAEREKEAAKLKQGKSSKQVSPEKPGPSDTSSEQLVAEEGKRKSEEASTSRVSIDSSDTPSKRKKVSDPLGRMEFRDLRNGCYTLIHDFAFEMGEKSALDVILHFNHDFEVEFDDGGYLSYIDSAPHEDVHDMECELLTVEPRSNCLSLVYRCDEGNCRFLKHINRSHQGDYQDLYCVYYEKSDDLPKPNERYSA